MVDVEKLDSDRVLFLIWRFLLESNFRETAAKLQKEWQVPQPHRQFDFARYIKTHALVSLIHRGLQHHALEREFHQIEASHDSAADVTEDTRLFGIFGPLITEPVPTFDELEDDEDDDDTEMMDDEPESDVSRKRPGDRRRSSPAKRQRLSYGYESGGVDAATSAMELDHHENGHAYPSPLEGDQAPTPLPRTEGPAVSTQVDKVVDLSADTTFLQLQREDPNDSSAAENLPILLHCDWNPQDPTLLAAAGTDALARVWTIPSSPTDHLTQHVNAAASELIASIADIPPHATVTAMAWNHEGGQIAVATAAGSRAQVIVSDLNSTVICDFEVPEPPIIKMKWSPNDAYILTVSPDTEGALISVLPLDRTDPATFPLKHDLIKAEPLDASWTGDVEFIVCGGTALKSFRYTDNAISMIRKFETRDDDMLAHVQYDPTSKLIATGSDKGVVDFWDESGERRSINAHIGQITALRWQPSPADSPQDERLIATAGEDGVISIWNSRKPESKAKCSIRLELPVVALSFTPDGSFVAGATSERVYIWKTGDFVMPRAVWSRTPHPGWLSPKTPETEEEDDHCLCWDSNGQKLAYGVNSRLAIINFAASENDTPHS